MNKFKIETDFQEEAVSNNYYKYQQDRLKSRKFVYNSFPFVHKNSIEMNDIRSFVYADAYARYLTYCGNSVLFTTGINNTSEKIYNSVSQNVLSLDDPYSNLKLKSYADLKKMDIIFESERKNESHSKQFISFIQDAFLKLYKFEHIVKVEDSFYLDFEKIKDDVIEELNDKSLFDDLKEFLNYKVGISVVLNTTCEQKIETVIQKPELLSGVNFIAIKPSVSARSYYAVGEQEYIKEYIRNKKGLGVFSGNFAFNPITDEYIPIVISNYFSDAIHLGISCDSDIDLLFSSFFQFEYKQIVTSEKTLINSHFLDGLKLLDAREKVVDFLVDNYSATTKISYDTKLLISTEYNDGISIPFYENEVITKQELPVLIDSKNNVRTINSKLPRKKITSQVFTTDITNAFLNLASRSKNGTGITDYSSPDFLLDIKDFPRCDYSIFHSKIDFLYTLVLNMITLKSFNLEHKKSFRKIYIIPDNPDTKTMIELTAVLSKFGACSLRYNMLSVYLNEIYYYNVDNVLISENTIQKFINIYDYEFTSEFKDLDVSYKNLVENSTKLIELNDFPIFIELLNDFISKVHEYKKISSRQAKGLLILFSLIAPSICECIYKNKFKKSYPLMFDAWPI